MLQGTIELLSKRDEMAFDGSIPSEVAGELNVLIDRINSNERIELHYLKVLFAATGPIQECAIANGWQDDFLAISSRFDEAIS